MTTKYSLPLTDTPQLRLAVGWLCVAVGFLLASGVYPLLLALARTTYEMPWKDFFYTALVLHVDFTVLWWLLAIAGVFWSLNSTSRAVSTGWAALMLVVIGGILTGISPLTNTANPLTNNYVPILENHYFIKGMIVFGGGVLLLVLRTLYAAPMRATFTPNHEGAIRFGIWTAAIATLIAILALIWTLGHMPSGLEHRAYYEPLFWAGGHVIQFAHTALLCVCWLWLANACGIQIFLGPKIVMAVFAISIIPLLFIFMPFAQYGVGTSGFALWFVKLMRDGNGIAPLVIGLAVIWGLVRGGVPAKDQRHLYLALLFSMLLFATGGVLGLYISTSSTLITAHYHGVIVSVTMAFMAMTYYWLPRFNFATPNLKWAKIQVYTYATGQMIHVIGLAWGGGHGMKRKVVGTTQDIGVHAFISPQDLVGLGGVIAVLSGILFAIVVLPVMFKGRNEGKAHV